MFESQSKQHWKVKVTRDPLLNAKKTLVATVTSNRIPLYDISPKDLLPLTAHLVRDKRDAMFLSIGARCSSERTEKRKVKKILDRGGNIRHTRS